MVQAVSLNLTEKSLGFFSNKTKDRILTSSLVLFNEDGFNNVTTASIAKQTGILEGSLWYHFNSKKILYQCILKFWKKFSYLQIRISNQKTLKQSLMNFFNLTT